MKLPVAKIRKDIQQKYDRALHGALVTFTPQEVAALYQEIAHWQARFWAKHAQWLEALQEDMVRPLQAEVTELRAEVDSLRSTQAAMEEMSPGRELIGAVTRTRWFKRRLEKVQADMRP